MKKKTNPILIIVLVIIFLLILVAGGLLLFFLVIKPNFIDNNTNEEQEEKVDWKEIYSKFLKDEIEEDYSIALVDFNEDDIPELIVRNDKKYLDSVSTIKKGKINTFTFKNTDEKYYTLDYLFDSKEDYDSWYIVDSEYNEDTTRFDYKFIDLVKITNDKSKWESIKEVEEKIDHLDSIYSLAPTIDFKDVDSDTYKDVLKERYNNNEKGYINQYSVSEIKKSLEKEKDKPKDEDKDDDKGKDQKTYDTSAFKEIKGTDIKWYSMDRTIVVVIARQSCGYCQQYIPLLEVTANSFEERVYYIDLEKIVDISKEEVIDNASVEAINALSGDGEWKDFAKNNFGTTPLTLFVKEGKVIYGLTGAVDESTLTSAFKTAGFKIVHS